MAIRKFKPTSPARRFMTVSTFEEITTNVPEKSLLEPIKKNAGRNSYGRITVRHRGGGERRKYRIIDFKRNKDNMPATVLTIEYDPNRSASVWWEMETTIGGESLLNDFSFGVMLNLTMQSDGELW